MKKIIIILIALLVIMTGLYIHKSAEYDHIYKLAFTDGLTKLYNNRYFKEKLSDKISKSSKDGTAFSIIMLDIDSFKLYNDTYGHQAGDAVLIQMADLLKNSVSNTDVVARFGGDEMIVLLDSANYDDAIKKAENIRKATENKVFILPDDIKTKLTLSLGVATYPKNAIIARDLIKYADENLYLAKEKGKNQVGKTSK